MLYKKEGFPQADELVLCTVTSVQHNSVFAKLDEYDRVGMIHISEISPGRIRNIRDFVVEGKKMVCKILNIDKVKGHIDLSLRRVNEGQKRKKMDEIKQEIRAENIIEQFAKSKNLVPIEIYNLVGSKVFEKYEYIHQCFEEIIKEKTDLDKLGVDQTISSGLNEFIKEKIKPQEVTVLGDISLLSYNPDGVEDIREAIKKAENAGKDSISIKYLGGGKYRFTITSPNYKEAEKILKASVEAAIKAIEKKGGEGNFKRKDK